MPTCQAAEARYGWVRSEPEPGHAWFDPVVLAYCARLKPRRVLDLGCGNGALSAKLAHAGYQVVGCDEDESGLALARRVAPGVTFKRVGVYEDPATLDEGPFDVVVSTEVIEHLFLPRRLPRFAAQVLRPGGHLIVTTPYHGYWKDLLIALRGRWDVHHDVFWDCGHIKFFSRATLTRMVAEAGFVAEGFRGAGRLPLLWSTMVLLARRL